MLDGNDRMDIGKVRDLAFQAYDETMDLLEFMYDKDTVADAVLSDVALKLNDVVHVLERLAKRGAPV